MSGSVQNNKFEYINITKIALNYKKIEVQRSVDPSCVVTFVTLFDLPQNTNNDKTRQLHKSK